MRKTCLILITLLLAFGQALAVRYGIKKQIYVSGAGAANPSYLCYSLASNRMYSGNTGTNEVVAIDCANDSLMQPVSNVYPGSMVYDQINDRIYLHDGGINFFAINCVDNKLDTTLGYGQGGGPVDYNPLDNKIYHLDQTFSQIFAFNGVDYSVNTFFGYYNMFYYQPKNMLYTGQEYTDTMLAIDGSTNVTIAKIGVSGLAASGFFMTADTIGGRVYVAMPNWDIMSVIDPSANIEDVRLGLPDNPADMAFCPINRKMFVACNGKSNYSLAVIDTFNKVDSIQVGDSVSTVVYNPADSLIYIGCNSSGYVKLIDPRLSTPKVVDSLYLMFRPQFKDMSVDKGGDVYVAIYNSDNIYVIGQIPQRIWRTVSSYNWSNYQSWNFSDDGGKTWDGNSMMYLPYFATDSLIVIDSFNTINIDLPLTVDQLVVNGTLEQNAMVTVNNGAGDDIIVKGIYTRLMGPLALNPGATMVFDQYSTYNHNMNGDAIPYAVWDTLSLLIISGVISTMPAGMNQAFGNITWDGQQQAVDVTLPGGPAFSAKDISIISTGSLAPYNIYFTSAAKPSLTINNLNISNGTAILGAGGPRKLFVKGNLSVFMPGWLYLTDNSNAGIDTLFLYGNYSHLASGIGGGGPDSTAIVFCGADTQYYSAMSEILSGYVNYQVNPGAFLKLSAFGDPLGYGSLGSFTLMPGATIGIADKAGIHPIGVDSGAVRVLGARNYSPSANYYYYSEQTGPYRTGPGLPDTVNQLTVNGVDMTYLSKDVAVMDTLKLLSNNLFINGYRLTLFGPIYQTSGNLWGDSLASLVIMGGNPAPVTLPSWVRDLRLLNINRPAVVTMTDTMLIYDRLELVNGVFDNGGNKLSFLDGATIFRTPNGSLAGINPTFVGSINLEYGGGLLTSGIEMPYGLTPYLGRLTVEGPGDTLIVNDSIAVHDTLSLAGGLVINGDYISLYKSIDTLKSHGLLSTSPATTIYLMDPGAQAYLPRIDGGHLNIDSTNGATMGGDVILSGNIKTNTSPLNISHYTLSIADSVIGTGGLVGDSTSSIVVYGTNSGISLPIGLDTLKNLTLDNPNGLTLLSELVINNMLGIKDGDLYGDTLSNYVIYGTNGTLIYQSGAVAQVTSDITYFHNAGLKNLVIDNPNGVTLHADRSVENSLQLINGSLATGSNTIKVDSTGQVIDGNGWVDGNLVKYIQAGAGIDTFPVGSANGKTIAALSFNNVSTAGYLTVAAVNSTHPKVDSTNYCISRYWSFTKDGALIFDSCNAELGYLSSDFVPSFFDEATYENTMAAGLYDSIASPSWSFPAIGSRNVGSTNDGGSIQLTSITNLNSQMTLARDKIYISKLPDTTQPFISSADPVDGALEVAVDAAISVTFSEPIDTSTFSYTFVPNPGGLSVVWSADSTIASFAHNNLLTDTVYLVSITNAVDTAGNALGTGAVPNPWSFRTISTPTVVSSSWTGGAYKLFSSPVKPTVNPAVTNLGDDLGAYSDSTWQMFGYNLQADSFVSNPDIYNGYGYWLASINDATLDVQGIKQDSYSTVGLDVGWNLIGCPFLNPVLVQSIEVIDSLSQLRMYNDTINNMYLNDSIIRQRMWNYADNSYDLVNNGAWDSLSAFDSTSHLQPWQGYAVYALQSCSLFMMPAFKSSAKGVQFVSPPKTDVTWQAEFSAFSGSAADRGIRIGISPQARDGYDRMDAEKPPLVSNSITVYIPHSDWNQGPCQAYQYDFRPQADYIEWPLMVQTSENEKSAELSYSLSQTLPNGYQLYLVDRRTGQATVIRNSGKIGFSGSQEFAVIFTNSSLGGLSLKPLSFDLNRIYPNPFTHSITVNYQLSAAGHVSLKVYNVAGQLVKTVVDETALPGYYSQVWNGCDNFGRKIASGVYIMRLVSGGQEKTRKLVKIK